MDDLFPNLSAPRDTGSPRRSVDAVRPDAEAGSDFRQAFEEDGNDVTTGSASGGGEGEPASEDMTADSEHDHAAEFGLPGPALPGDHPIGAVPDATARLLDLNADTAAQSQGVGQSGGMAPSMRGAKEVLPTAIDPDLGAVRTAPVGPGGEAEGPVRGLDLLRGSPQASVLPSTGTTGAISREVAQSVSAEPQMEVRVRPLKSAAVQTAGPMPDVVKPFQMAQTSRGAHDGLLLAERLGADGPLQLLRPEAAVRTLMGTSPDRPHLYRVAQPITQPGLVGNTVPALLEPGSQESISGSADTAATGRIASLASVSAVAPQPQLAGHIAQQLATAHARVQDLAGAGAVEVALDPPELGRVRMVVSEVNGAMTLTISAERAETADLMRRHMALLGEEFSRSGLDAPNVNISQGGGQGGHAASSDDAHHAPARDAPAPTDMDVSAMVGTVGAPASSSLDLRL